ncbi:DUF6461 domain-containing protein [Streptomyces sp. NBC_01217]|uniref:DUF6461 domain-containing protein n=1 Tax=Streptomyces sp. NBC_01217 TaxID=2903779 RepID=UPI003FA3CD87
MVTTGTDSAWTWAWGQDGSHGLDERVLSPVSRGTEAVALYYNEKRPAPHRERLRTACNAGRGRRRTLERQPAGTSTI